MGLKSGLNSKITQADTAVDIRSYVNVAQGCSLYGAYYRNRFVTIWGGTDKFNAAGTKIAITSMSAYKPRIGGPSTITGGYASGSGYHATNSDASNNTVSINEDGKLEVYWGKETIYGTYYSITFPAYPPIA